MKAIGIDLGTTNSASAMGGKNPHVLPTRDGEQLTPSVVSLVRKRKSQETEIVIGRRAVNNARSDPLNTIFSIKRLMGLIYGEQRLGAKYGSHGVQDVKERVSFRIAPPPPTSQEDQGVKVLLGDELLSPVEISAMILRHIREDAETALGEPVTHAVITVPAYFEERQRKATVDAGILAGLEVLQIIDEPTAAAIAFGATREDERHRVLVYDLGGGTFDISIIQMTRGKHQVLEIQGDNWLGGDDFDITIVKRMIEWVRENYDGFDPSSDTVFLAKAKAAAERVKIALSSQKSASILEVLVAKTPDGQTVDIEMDITREEFEADIVPFVERTIELVHAALKNQSFTPDSITEVLLVGGSTAVQLVQQRVADVFGREKVKRTVNPMECVALGAGILSSQFELKDDGAVDSTKVDNKIVQATALHLGIAAVKGQNIDAFVPIIEKGTPFPLSEPKKQIFMPTAEGQKVLRIPVYEGLNELASLNEQQGVLELPLDQGVSVSTPIEVAFNYDRSRTLTITVKVGNKPPIKEMLRHDHGRPKPDSAKENLTEDWREELQPCLRAAQHFQESYGEFMDADDRHELVEEIKQAAIVLDAADEGAGRRMSAVLHSRILSSGAASQLFLAERVLNSAPAQDATEIAKACAMFKDALRTGRTEQAAKLGMLLRTRTAQVLHENQQRNRIPDRQLDDLLRVRDSDSSARTSL